MRKSFSCSESLIKVCSEKKMYSLPDICGVQINSLYHSLTISVKNQWFSTSYHSAIIRRRSSFHYGIAAVDGRRWIKGSHDHLRQLML